MNRRCLVGAGLTGAALLASPRIGRGADRRTLRFVPYSDLSLVDPVVNTATPTRNHAFLVFDTLYGLDDAYQAQPQMVDGHVVEGDGRRWRLRLREQLAFHDGTPVLARDAVASIQRWAARDGFGQALLAATEVLSAPDDRTVEFRLRRPFPLLPDALGKVSPNVCAIMPERLARTDPAKPITEMVGSGPFRFVEAERVPGSRAVYARFEGYVPRPDGTPSISAGPKVVRVDRVEWLTMPDAATAAAALQRGEVEWVEAPSPDLVPLLRAARGLRVAVNDKAGIKPILRFNCIQPPFDNPAVRRAVLRAVDQTPFMQAYSGDPTTWQAPVGVFCPGTPMASDAGMAGLFGPTDLDRARRELAAAGYRGEPVALLAPTEHPISGPLTTVAEDLFRKVGLAVDLQAMDLGTMNVRRNSREPVGRGGWSCFPSSAAGLDYLNPATSVVVRGNGLDGWYGWPTDERLERLRASWMNAPDVDAQKGLAAEIQAHLLLQATFVPVGEIYQPQAFTDRLTSILPGFVKFYGLELG